MKTNISKSVLVIVTTGLALSAALVWFGLHPREKVAEPSAMPVTSEPLAGKSVVPPVPAPAKQIATTTVPNNRNLLPVIPISLTNVMDAAETDLLLRNDAGLKALPQGTQVLGGIEFWLQGLVYLQGVVSRDDEHASFRQSIIVPLDETNFTDEKWMVTQRGQNIACIYLVAATRFGAQVGEKFAEVVWHYADGTSSRSEIKYNVQLRDWWRVPYEDPAQLPNALTKVAWHGMDPTRKNGSIRLYRVAFVNPHVEKTIRSLEFASAMARPSLFIAALTLDPLLPGARPDNLTSDEMADPELNGQLQLLVQDTDGHPLSAAEVSANSRSSSSGSIKHKFSTDLNGMALVRYPDIGLETLEVSAIHDDYSGRKMLWDLKSGDTVPASYTLKLAAEVKIGGMVVDAEGNPVSGASISLYRFWSGNDGDPNKKGEQPAFSNQKQMTDDQGRWQANGLPAELLDHIGFEISHPDFVGTSVTVGQNATAEKQLREGNYKTVLQRGQDVSGRVVDENGSPVSGATIWAGRKYTRDRKQATSEADGHFFFHSVQNGDVLFAVMASGHAADSKTVNVHADMSEIVFQLKAGSVLKAHVQDESGQPVADARMGLEGGYGDPSYDAYEFSANTDSNGDFTWDSAPRETMTFYIFHDGFEAKRDAKLTANQDNIVTLRRSRTLQGLVLDATTEQPITKFTVRTGTASGDNSDVYGVIRYKDFTAADGRFSMSLEEEADNAVAVYATDYADKIEKFPDAQNGTVQVVVRLKPSASLNGVVLAPDGTPASGVNVAVASEQPRTSLQLSVGHLRSYDSHTKMATTDAAGRFKVDVAGADGTVMAVGDPGYASVPLAAVRDSGTIALQAWGRVEGTLKIGGQPGVGKDLLFNLSIPGVGTDFNGYKSTTDDQGQFTMEKIPPGNGEIVRLIATSPNSWQWSDRTAVTIKPGETTQVTLGDNGAMIAGRIRFDNPPTNDAALSYQGNLSGQMPQTPAFNSPQEAQAYYQSPEWQALAKLRKNYTLEMKPDGTFTADDVVPGNYSLNISASLSGQRPWEHPPVAQGSMAVTVPDSFSPSQPIDIGEVVLKPNLQQ